MKLPTKYVDDGYETQMSGDQMDMMDLSTYVQLSCRCNLLTRPEAFTQVSLTLFCGSIMACIHDSACRSQYAIATRHARHRHQNRVSSGRQGDICTHLDLFREQVAAHLSSHGTSKLGSICRTLTV